MKTALKAGVFAALSLASAAVAFAADEEGAWGPFTAGVSLTSDYRFRGVSQSDRGAAIQGWVKYEHASGFFGNIWASNVDFNDTGITTTDDTNLEVDLTVGYNHSFSDQLSGGIKAVYYWYADADYLPGAPDYDYFELIANLGYDFGKASVSGELAWTPDNFGETDDAVALTGGVTVPLMDSFAFFDGDFYSSIMDSFKKVYHKMQPGGIILVHDYDWPVFPGTKKACDDFLADKPEKVVCEINGIGKMVKQ